MLVYKITFPNNKIYIGITSKSLEERKINHKKFIKKAKLLVHKAMKKYGYENLIWEVLEECSTENELYYLEKYYIKYYNSFNSKDGYNLTKGGDGVNGYSPSNETKRLLSEKATLQWINSSPEQKEINRLRALQVLAGKNKKKVIDNFGNIFESISSAAKHYNLSPSGSGLVQAIKKQKRVKNILSFKYYEDGDVSCPLWPKTKPNRIYKSPSKKTVQNLVDFISVKVIDFNGIKYNSITEAARQLKISRSLVYKKLKNGEFFYGN